jgi:hypothetical protein
LELITINKTHNELGHQLEFLIRKEFSIAYKKYLSYPVFLIVWTILFGLLLHFTDDNNFITLKVITLIFTAVFWFISLIIFTIIAIQFFKRKIWKRKSINAELLNNSIYEIGFDEEKIYYRTDGVSSEIPWGYFKFYAIKNTHLFLISADNLYESSCVSQSEIGADNFDALTSIAFTKLLILKN